MPKPVCPNMATATARRGRDGAEAEGRVAQAGRATIRPRIRLPEGAARKVSASVRRACIQGNLPWRPPLPAGAETAQKRKAGLLKLDAQPSAPESVFPRARHGRSLPRSGELAFRETYAASGPNREPGRIRRLRISLPARQWRLRDACGLSRLDDLVALWSQAHMPSCNRQVTSTSVHMAKPGSASAPSRSRTAIIGHIVFGSNNFRSPNRRGLIAMLVAWAVACRLSLLGGGGSSSVRPGVAAGQRARLTRQVIWRSGPVRLLVRLVRRGW